jgi:hypothetical protein
MGMEVSNVLELLQLPKFPHFGGEKGDEGHVVDGLKRVTEGWVLETSRISTLLCWKQGWRLMSNPESLCARFSKENSVNTLSYPNYLKFAILFVFYHVLLVEHLKLLLY